MSVLDGVRSILGVPELVVDGVYQWGNIAEYTFCCILCLVVVSSVFRFLTNLVKR